MNTQSLILAILNFGDATGYEIKKQSTEGAFSFFVDISYGSIYPTLARLEDEKLVVGRSESQSGKPDKKIYSLTSKGRAAFVQSLGELPQKDKFKSEFLLLAMCADLCTPEIVECAINKQIGETKEIYDLVTGLREECDDEATQWVADFGMHVKKAALEYLTQNRKKLVAMAGNGLNLPDAAE